MLENNKPFEQQNDRDTKKKLDTFTTRLNEEERQILNKSKQILEQPKDSTAWKQLALLGANVLHDKKMGMIIRIIFKNKQKNNRLGIVDFD